MAEILGTIVWYRGDSYPLDLIIKNNAEELIDLTGYTFLMTIDSREEPDDDSTMIFEVIGVIDPDQVTNKGKISFTPTQIQTAIDIKEYYYDVAITYGAGNIYDKTIAKDIFEITQDISK